MADRTNSSGTLLDGMAEVGHGDISQLSLRDARKRELKEMIEVIWIN